MKGKVAVLDKGMAALLVNGRIMDLMFDPPEDDLSPRPEAIYRAVVDRPIKGMGGAIVKLTDGQNGFLKDPKGLSPGSQILVQVSTFADGRKASPVSRKILFKNRFSIITPDAPGINVARSIRDEAEHDRLLEIAHDVMDGGPEGLILRSAASRVDEDQIRADITQVLNLSRQVMTEATGQGPELLMDAPSAMERAWREWEDVDQIVEHAGALADFGVLDEIDKLTQAHVELANGGSLSIEPTAALVAIDVNTGGDTSPAVALKTNLSAIHEISRQLKLRGLGGQVIIDFAPSSKRDRVQIENTLKSALKRDGVETIIAGWTPLGNLELQRKRDRYPLSRLK